LAVFEDLLNQFLTWLAIGGAVGIIVAIGFVAFTVFVLKKFLWGLFVKGFLIILAWVPSVFLAMNLDTGAMPSVKVVSVSGWGLVLYPYTWDVLFGSGIAAITVISAMMIVVSYLSMLDIAWEFHKHRPSIPVYLVPFIAYLGLVCFGLGMLNSHLALLNAYSGWCLSNGMHPLVPVMFASLIVAFVLFMVYGRKYIFKSY